MFSLTERRLRLVEPILESYRGKLLRHRRFDVPSLERELRQQLDTGYRELKGFAAQLLKVGRYTPVAVFFLQFENGSGVVSDNQPALAKFFGISNYYSPERDAAATRYWENVFADGQLAEQAS